MCDCIKHIEEKFSALVKEKHKYPTEIEGEWLESKAVILPEGGNPGYTSLNGRYTYIIRRKKVNGEPFKNTETKTIHILYKFCPICGEKYPTGGQSNE